MGQTKGQLGKEPSHVRIYHRQMRSAAWRHLSPSAIKTLLALASLERGDNNGEVYLSDRKGAEMTGMSRNTVRKSLAELIDKGFLYCSERGGFSRKVQHAACYGLTWAAGPKGTPWRAPSHAYEQWAPDGNTRDQYLTETGPNSDIGVETRPRTGAGFEPVEMETPLVSTDQSMSGIEPQTVYQSPRDRRAGNGNREHSSSAVDPRASFLDRLRLQLIDHLQKSAAGEQSRIATAIGCPGGTLSKFVGGRGLPQSHSAPLAQELTRRGATGRKSGPGVRPQVRGAVI